MKGIHNTHTYTISPTIRRPVFRRGTCPNVLVFFPQEVLDLTSESGESKYILFDKKLSVFFSHNMSIDSTS